MGRHINIGSFVLLHFCRWKLLKTTCGSERMVVYIKNCVQQHVRYRLAFIVRRTHRVQMHHMWVIRLLIDGDHFQRLADIVCDCDPRWVQIYKKHNNNQQQKSQQLNAGVSRKILPQTNFSIKIKNNETFINTSSLLLCVIFLAIQFYILPFLFTKQKKIEKNSSKILRILCLCFSVPFDFIFLVTLFVFINFIDYQFQHFWCVPHLISSESWSGITI